VGGFGGGGWGWVWGVLWGVVCWVVFLGGGGGVGGGGFFGLFVTPWNCAGGTDLEGRRPGDNLLRGAWEHVGPGSPEDLGVGGVANSSICTRARGRFTEKGVGKGLSGTITKGRKQE